MVRRAWAVTSLLLLAALCGIRADDKDKLFVASPLTKDREFTGGIEGPACDAAGNVYAVNYAKDGTIGRVTPTTWVASSLFRLRTYSVKNGIRSAFVKRT